MSTKQPVDKGKFNKSIWLGLTLFASLSVFAFISVNYQRSFLPIGQWVIGIILGGVGLVNLLLPTLPERIKYLNRVLGAWLIFGLVFVVYGVSEQRLVRELDEAKITAAAYREIISREVEIPVKSGHPRRISRFLLAPADVYSVRMLGINATSVIHEHRTNLQRIILEGGSVEILLLHPESEAFLDREIKEGMTEGQTKTANRIRKEWEASIAILRDILFHLLGQKQSMEDLKKRFQIRLHQKEPDRSLLFVNKREEIFNEVKKETRIADKHYLLLNRYPKSKKKHGQESLSLLVNKDWTEYEDNKNYFDLVWSDSNTVHIDLTDFEKVGGYPTIHNNDIVTQFKKLKKSTTWELVEEIKMHFKTHHPQGMVKIGDYIYFSTVEVIEWPEKGIIAEYDRTTGRGIGHLFKTDLQGNLIDSIELGEGNIYHPGGIDYDGKYIWVPVAQYRPSSKSIVYRVDPMDKAGRMKAVEVFRVDDHIGDIVYDKEARILRGVSWNGRWFYSWKLNKDGLELIDPAHPEKLLNGNHYIDYQDCHYAEYGYMLCAGLNKYDTDGDGEEDYAFGGIDLVDMQSLKAIHQVPVPKWVMPDLVMSHNPFFFELKSERLRFYFMPEDNDSRIYIYDTFD